MIKYCKRCLYSTDHPLGLTIDEEGICSGCRVHDEKDSLDWISRWQLLERLVKPYRSRSGDNYDCIIPVTGGQDSYYMVYLVKEKLGMSPLLVNYNKYFNTALGIRNLSNLRIRFNCDILFQNVNPVSVKKITRSTLNRFGSIYWPILAGHTVFPVQTAVRYKIPLIIWGAHQGIEQVGMFSHLHEVEMTRRYRKDHDLMGYEADDLLSIFDSLKEEDIWQYRYPDDSDLKAIGVRGIYLGNYVRWDPKAQHEQMIREYDYRTTSFARTFDCYDYVDCFNYMNIHDLMKFYKHGFSKVTDHASREIRHGRLTKEQGFALVKLYEQAPVQYSQLFLDWLGVTQNSLQFIFDQHRNLKYWSQPKFGNWELHKPNSDNVMEHVPNMGISDAPILFQINDKIERNESAKYITYGKGWP